tara:strand:+ start:508 stop:879 length:372 start_codon:yes stop_codon:yes gene_type:complete
MAKLHHTEYKKNYKNYILSNIDEDIEGNPITSEADKIKYIFDRFNSEYGWRVNQVGKVAAMVDWLQGLALNIEFYNDEIINLAIRLGSIDENPSEKLQDRVIENYWNFMANIILGFESRKVQK